MKQEQKLEKKYAKTQKISQGSYGVVYKGKNIQTGETVAIKKFKNITNQGIPVSCIRQLDILNILKCSQVEDPQNRTLRLFDVYQVKDQIYMVVEWMDETLSQIFEKNQPYNKQKVFKDILKSLLQLHQNFVIHRDIKPKNIMISHATGIMKILDYGMAKQIDFEDKSMTNEVGSLYYRAPQLLIGSKKYDFSVDIWALGCVFYQILTKKVLFKGQTQLDQLKKIFEVTGTQKITQIQNLNQLVNKIVINLTQSNWKSIESELKPLQLSLLKKMLNLDPKQRPSVSQILSDPYFKEEQDLQ